MSMQHWKNTNVVKPDLTRHFQNLIAYAKQKNKVVTIFDLEATTFLGRSNFGVTELGMVHITPSGNIGVSGSLVNPERSVSKEAADITGITNAMVKDLKNWEELWLEAISYIAQNHILIGFNSTSFDTKALQHMHKRHGVDDLSFEEHIDLRTVVNKISGTTKGKLAEIADQFSIDVSDFKGHRASDDALLTAKIFDVVIERYPDFEKYLIPVRKDKTAKEKVEKDKADKNEPKAKREPSPYKLAIQSILEKEFANAEFYDSNMLKPMANVLHIQYPDKTVEQLVTALSFELGTMQDNGELPMLAPKDIKKKEWLTTELFKNLVQAAWSDPTKANKLAPALEMTDASKLGVPFDYTELRWGLNYHGLKTPKSKAPASGSPQP